MIDVFPIPVLIHCWVITFGTKDYGQKYVVRHHSISCGEVVPDEDPLLVTDVLEVAREEVKTQGGCYRISRMFGDDPVIVESWF